MTYRDAQRVADVVAAIDAIRLHLERGDLTDGLVFDAVRIRTTCSGECRFLVAMIIEPPCPHRGNQTLTRRGTTNRGQANTSHAILQATVEHDLPELELAASRLAKRLSGRDHEG